MKNRKMRVLFEDFTIILAPKGEKCKTRIKKTVSFFAKQVRGAPHLDKRRRVCYNNNKNFPERSIAVEERKCIESTPPAESIPSTEQVLAVAGEILARYLTDFEELAK